MNASPLTPPPSPLIVILGPTASGKSSLGIKLARKYHGEIISADSRQVYKGMDIGSGKVTKAEQKLVRHHLLDVASPKKQFTVSDFKSLGLKAILEIQKKHKVPFIVGGTAFYIYSLVDDWQIPQVKPDLKLRRNLKNKSAAQLFEMLKKLDPRRAANIDPHNPARLIRAIEIVKSTGQPIPVLPAPSSITPHPLFLGIKKEQNQLYKLIDKRLEARIPGIIKEIKKLHKSGVSWKRLQSFGLEYNYVTNYVINKVSYEDMIEQLKNAIHHFSKRQMTWFKRDKRIIWVTNEKQTENLVKKYLSLRA